MADGTEVKTAYLLSRIYYLANDNGWLAPNGVHLPICIYTDGVMASAQAAILEIAEARKAFKNGIRPYMGYMHPAVVSSIRAYLDNCGWGSWHFTHDLNLAPEALLHDVRISTDIRFIDISEVPLLGTMDDWIDKVGEVQPGSNEVKTDIRFEDIDL